MIDIRGVAADSSWPRRVGKVGAQEQGCLSYRFHVIITNSPRTRGRIAPGWKAGIAPKRPFTRLNRQVSTAESDMISRGNGVNSCGEPLFYRRGLLRIGLLFYYLPCRPEWQPHKSAWTGWFFPGTGFSNGMEGRTVEISISIAYQRKRRSFHCRHQQ